MVPVEPAESPTVSTGYKTDFHRIQGISDEFIASIVKLDELDEVLAVSNGDSILMAQKTCGNTGSRRRHLDAGPTPDPCMDLSISSRNLPLQCVLSILHDERSIDEHINDARSIEGEHYDRKQIIS